MPDKSLGRRHKSDPSLTIGQSSEIGLSPDLGQPSSSQPLHTSSAVNIKDENKKMKSADMIDGGRPAQSPSKAKARGKHMKRKREKDSKEPDTLVVQESHKKRKQSDLAENTKDVVKADGDENKSGQAENVPATVVKEGGKDKKRRGKKKRKSAITSAHPTDSQKAVEAPLPLTENGASNQLPSHGYNEQTAEPGLTAHAKSNHNDDLQKYLDMHAPSSHPTTQTQTIKKKEDEHQADKEKQDQLEKEKERARKKEEAKQALILQLETAKSEAEREVEVLKARVRELEAKTQKDEEDMASKDAVILQHDQLREKLKEAVSCGVCFETLKDPHTLACGHIACKHCLVTWFRSPNAYVSKVPDPVPEDMNLSYWTKICHTCRTYTVNRPIRMYHLQSMLEPLGIDPHIPAASQQAKQGTADDPWKDIFPVEKDFYKIFDESDGVDRCPNCLAEIDEGACVGCGAEFSEAEEDIQDFATEGDDNSGDDSAGEDDMGAGPGLAWYRERAASLAGFDEGPEDASNTDESEQRPRVRTRRAADVDPSEDHDIDSDSESEVDQNESAGEDEGISSGSDADSRPLRPARSGTSSRATRSSTRDRRASSPLAPARERRAPIRNRAADQAQDRARRRRNRGEDGLAPGVASFLDIFADESDDEDMTNDEGEGSIGERGDYPENPSGSEQNSEAEEAAEGEESDEDGYEDSFIDDDEIGEDFSEAGESDSLARGDNADDSSVDSNAIRRDSRRMGSRAASIMRRGEESEESDAGGEVDVAEMRRRRLARLGGGR